MFTKSRWFFVLMLVLLVCGQACSLTGVLGPDSIETQNQTSKEPATSEDVAGSLPITLTVSVPEGVRVVEQGAVWAEMPGETALHIVYAALVLESDAATLGFLMDYQLWMPDDQESASNTKTNSRLWYPIPARQTGAYLIKMGDYPAWMKPKKIEIQLKAGNFFAERQKDLDALNDPAYPSPYFTMKSTELTASQGEGGYEIKAIATIKNNLPVEAGVAGLFLFYDDAGQVIGMTTSLCSDAESYGCGGTLAQKITGDSEGKIDTSLPYRLDAQPAEVKMYPIYDTNFAQYLLIIK